MVEVVLLARGGDDGSRGSLAAGSAPPCGFSAFRRHGFITKPGRLQNILLQILRAATKGSGGVGGYCYRWCRVGRGREGNPAQISEVGFLCSFWVSAWRLKNGLWPLGLGLRRVP